MPRFIRTDQGRVPVPDSVPRGQEKSWFDDWVKQTQETNAEAVARAQFEAQNPAGQPSQDTIGRFKSWLTDEPKGKPAPLSWTNAPGRIGRSLGRNILPGSVPQAATDVALLGASAIAPSVGAVAARAGAGPFVQGAARMATRVGLPAAASAATGGTALEGALPAALGEIVGLPSIAGAAARKFGHLDSATFLRRVRNAIGPEFAQAIAKDIDNPAMSRILRTPEDVARLVTQARGHDILGAQFDTLEADISRVLRSKGAANARVPIPIEAAEAAGWKPETGTLQDVLDPVYRGAPPRERPPLVDAQGMPVTPSLANRGQLPTHYMVSPEEALDIGKILRDKARSKAAERMGQQQYDINSLGEQVTQAVLQAVDQVDPVLAQRYGKLRDSYRNFIAIRDLVEAKPTELLPGSRKLAKEAATRGGVSIDLPNFWQAIRENLNRISPERFPNLHEFFTGAPGTLSGPERVGPIQALRMARLYLRRPGTGMAAGETVPPFSRVANLPPKIEEALRKQAPNKTRAAAGVLAVPQVGRND